LTAGPLLDHFFAALMRGFTRTISSPL